MILNLNEETNMLHLYTAVPYARAISIYIHQFECIRIESINETELFSCTIQNYLDLILNNSAKIGTAFFLFYFLKLLN